MNSSILIKQQADNYQGEILTPEKEVIQTVLRSVEDIQIGLISRARSLEEECHNLIRNDFKDRKTRRPPITLSCRLRKDRYGPILVWIRFTIAKRKNAAGDWNRYTSEVGGRRNHSYPSAIFKPFRDPDLIEGLIDIERRAAAIRRETSEWSSMITSIKTIEKLREGRG